MKYKYLLIDQIIKFLLFKELNINIIIMHYINFNKYNTPIIDIKYEIDELNEYPEFIIIGSNYKFKFEAVGDCCSLSLFKEYNGELLNSIIGKTIKSIKEIELPDDYDTNNEVNYQEFLSVHLYEMIFQEKNETPFKFILNNYSNGYYDGYISASIIN